LDRPATPENPAKPAKPAGFAWIAAQALPARDSGVVVLHFRPGRLYRLSNFCRLQRLCGPKCQRGDASKPSDPCGAITYDDEERCFAARQMRAAASTQFRLPS